MAGVGIMFYVMKNLPSQTAILASVRKALPPPSRVILDKKAKAKAKRSAWKKEQW